MVLFEAMDFVALAKGVSALHKGECPDLDFVHDSHVVFGLWENFYTVVGAASDAEDLPAKFPRRRKTARGAVIL